MREEMQPLRKIFEKFSGRMDMYSLLSDFFAMAALEISVAVDRPTSAERAAELGRIRAKYSDSEQKLFAQALAETITLFDRHGLYDWLGELYMESSTSSKRAGQFFTPYSLSRLAATTTAKRGAELLADGEDVITVSEPTCGAGGMVLALADVLREQGVNYAWHMAAECCDLDERCVHMAYVQLSLAGIPAVVRRQNTLTMERYGPPWHTPALVFNWLHFRRYVKEWG